MELNVPPRQSRAARVLGREVRGSVHEIRERGEVHEAG